MDLQSSIQELASELVDSGAEIGLQVAAYLDGELVLDVAAGVIAQGSTTPVTSDTLFLSWSTTKGFTATCLHLLAERGQIDYDKPISYYWPEFGAHGKQHATVNHALTHRSGVPHMPEGVDLEMLCNWDAMARAIADLKPLWEPGTKVAYHAWTFGWIIGELIRRVDGRPISQFAQEELCRPLGIDGFYMGIPNDLATPIATLSAEPVTNPAPTSAFLESVMPAHITNTQVANTPAFQRAVSPGSNGIMNARSIARHYALFANGGVLDGVRLFSPERITMMNALQTNNYDETLGMALRKGLGYMLGGPAEQGGNQIIGPSERAFGHSGLGGSIGFADPDRRLSVGITKNYMRTWADPKEATAYKIAERIRAIIDK
jgi:Beta-lactamase class C and other penicillin binding proteins